VIERVLVQRGRYFDSVRLMQASAVPGAVPGVERALVAMGTELNHTLLFDLGFEGASFAVAGPHDLIVAIRAADEAAATAAIAAVERALGAPTAAADGSFAAPPPRTIEGAARAAGANIALISVPGPHAFVEAIAALELGLSVMLFSDNVPVEQEIALKARAARRDLLVMGPDCGTAIVGGVGLGFANAVVPGPVGIVGASGTGIQQLCCLLDDAGVGVGQALGTGSRDLSDAVGGSSTVRALQALDGDPAIEVIVVVSKPPQPEAARRVREAAAACSTPTVEAFVGVTTLEDAAAATLGVLGRDVPEFGSRVAPGPARPGALRGLFSGGTLCAEARAVAGDLPGMVMLDLGDDEYTSGRPHPMIDQRTRLEHLADAAGDPAVGVVLLDVVLGYGAHSDPAAELAPAVEEIVAAGAAAVVSLCGTRGDPQGRDCQAEVLHGAGASVFGSNAAAARHAVALTGGGRS